MIDLEFIERLIRVLDESGLDHVEIERGGTRVLVSKSPPARVVEEPPPATPAPAHADALPATEPTAAASQTESEAAAEDLHEITSPMVGTFYRSPSPDAEPFTEVGERISNGDTLCIIEAMKLMNELEAETEGVIREICVADGEPVEYGQVLFRVQPD